MFDIMSLWAAEEASDLICWPRTLPDHQVWSERWISFQNENTSCLTSNHKNAQIQKSVVLNNQNFDNFGC